MSHLYTKMSFKISKTVIKTYSTSFSSAVSLLEKSHRGAISAIYGFVRLADEIVDTFHTNNQKLLLDTLERDLDEALATGLSMNPVLHSFVHVVKEYNIPQDQIRSFLQSMKTDLTKNEYNHSNELEEYIYGSAEVVGLMCLRVFTDGNIEKYKELELPAMKLGAAFQKVNFLRDLKADLHQLKRNYFSEIKDRILHDDVKLKLIEDIERDFAEARPGIKRLPGRAKLAVSIAYLYYRNLLHKLKNTPSGKILTARIRLGVLRKLMIFISGYLKWKFRLI